MAWTEFELTRGSYRFRTTRWTLLAAASSRGPDARGALDELCRIYWPPLYAFARRRGLDPHAALDATQGFFVEFLARALPERADPLRGRFRTFLLSCFSRFLAGEHQRATRRKRGGQCSIVSLDAAGAEDRYMAGAASPEQAFDRRWTAALIDQALARLREEHEARGRGELFTALSPWLQESRPVPYRDKAAELALSEGAVRVLVHRMRQRFAELLLEEVDRTLGDGEDAETELRDLLRSLSS